MLSQHIRNAGTATARTRCLNSHHRTTRRLLASTPSSLTRPSLTPRTPHQHQLLSLALLNNQGQRAYLTTTPSRLRQYEKHHDHINIKKPTSTSTTTPPNTTAKHRGAAASVVDQDLDDHHVQQAIDNLDLDTETDLKRRHSSHDAAALLDKDELGLQEEITVTSTTTTSVLLEDKQRSEEEFSWFVDKTYTTTTSSSINDDDKVSSQDFVPLWKRNARGQHHKHSKHHAKTASTTQNKDQNKEDDLKDAPVAIRGLVRMLEHERARNVTVMDMRRKCDWTDWMVIAEGLSERHVGNVADEVYTALKKMLPKTSPPLMEGRSTPDWVVIDTGSIILHFMTHETRKERNLEGLWGAVKDPLKLKDAEEISWEDVQKKLTESWNEDPGRSKGVGHGSKRGRRGEEDLSLDEVVKG
ncbi:hypothetical protein BG015_004560 [Linnemannia schmuckeri]|uniref:DUF143-domain-containing protein n=1 Tax=Linnemannia schmuckeri TaxID=64567 RepID=A0A9P5VD06_9FUNG|nr:hypothetical protein BG015_004560 [Linnemannia schmuckeri]